MVQPVRHIVIVGGGTAGWLTAGVIAAKHRARMGAEFSVTLVESPNTPIIGVGEGTWPTLRSTLARIGVSETEFFRSARRRSNRVHGSPAGRPARRTTSTITR
jgi:tryptophan halogenase